MTQIDEWLVRHVVCPRDKQPLRLAEGRLTCPDNHSYSIIEGVPVLMFDDGSPTHGYIRQTLENVARVESGESVESVFGITDTSDDEVDPFVQHEIPYTCGNLYFSVQNKLTRYPFPEFRLPEGGGKRLLDVGCNWGRWTIVAEQHGYRSVGFDPSLNAVLAAKRIAEKHGVTPSFVAADARYVPFAEGSFDVTFSYGVLQHLKKSNVENIFDEMARVTRDGGRVVVQMANKYGLRCRYQQFRLGFKDGKEGADVFYWTPDELIRTFNENFGESELSVDCYFGLNMQKSDLDLMPFTHRIAIHSSEVFRKLSSALPLLTKYADSVYIQSVNRKGANGHV